MPFPWASKRASSASIWRGGADDSRSDAEAQHALLGAGEAAPLTVTAFRQAEWIPGKR